MEKKRIDSMVVVSFPPAEKERLRQMAQKEHRTLSNMAASLLLEAMAGRERQQVAHN